MFADFPTLKFLIPHGGGAVPFHWGRYRGLALNNKRPPLDEMMKNNVWFDTCVYHQPGVDLLTKVVPLDNILFASEMVGAVRGDDPRAHKLHAEWGEIAPETAARINAARRVVAVGTTALRLLESAAREGGTIAPFHGLTELFLLPGHRFR